MVMPPLRETTYFHVKTFSCKDYGILVLLSDTQEQQTESTVLVSFPSRG